jgi:hypothetical protein
VVDGRGQRAEEGGEPVGVVRVERRVLRGPDVRGGAGEALRIPAGEDDLGALGAGAASRLEPDAGAAAEDDDGLAEQGRRSRTAVARSLRAVMAAPISGLLR